MCDIHECVIHVDWIPLMDTLGGMCQTEGCTAGTPEPFPTTEGCTGTLVCFVDGLPGLP